ncbi:MAG: DUF1648 domain-containing protein [Casimicrobiaceae bacterium]
MVRVTLGIFIAAVCMSMAYVALSAASLPDPVATHFGVDGRANGWMSRQRYLTVWLAATCVFPCLVTGSIVLITRHAPRLVNIPHRDDWFAPARRKTTIDWLTRAGLWLGTIAASFLAGLHGVLLMANRAQPPRLPGFAFLGLTGVFVTVLLVWTAAYYGRFRRLPRKS